jgi:hypothetical protein
MNRYLILCALAILWPESGVSQAPGVPAASVGQQAMATAAAQQKYTFLVFFKDNGPPTQAMIQMVQRGVQARTGRAVAVFVNVNNPSERALVNRFNVSRAPMPLTVAVAPNGALTSLCPKNISNEQIEKSFVTPGMANCMKCMQEGKLVLACVYSTAQPSVPAGVQDFCDDPEFKSRAALTFIQASDPAETAFFKQLEIDATAAATTVFLAPPGVLVGKFAASATKAELAAALHKAGHCCEDPNCKHSHGHSHTPAGASRPANPAPSTRRN